MKSLWIPGNGGKTLVLSILTVGLWLMGWAPVANAVDDPGPTVSTWIPSSDADETVGSVSIRLQPGPYNARDVYKVFVTAVADKDLQLVVIGSNGVKVDYFDEPRGNGLYAVFGAVDAGTITLEFQWRTTSPQDQWTSAGTKALTVGTQRTMSHDTEVPICTWYDTKAGVPNVANPSEADVESRLEIDFPNLKADGFNCVNIVWLEAWNKAKSTIYSNLTQHGMKIQQFLYTANTYVRDNMIYPLSGEARHNDVPLLGLEDALNTDMLADVGGGVALKDHPQLFSYYLLDEAEEDRARGVELEAMLAKNIDPNHGSGSSATGIHGSRYSALILQRPFSDFIVINNYPLGSATATSDFTKHNAFEGDLGYMNLPDYMDWAQEFDTRRYLDVFNQTHNTTSNRAPYPKELRALVMMSAARGSRPINYFLDGWFGGVVGLLGPGFVRTPRLEEAKLVNQKLNGWMPIYKHLKRAENGTKIPYTQKPSSSSDLFFSDFESGETTFGATNIAAAGHSGTHYGQFADENLHNQPLDKPLDGVPLYNSCVYTAWVNDNNNASMTYRLQARVKKSDGPWPYKYGSYVNIGPGWQQLTLDLTPEAGDGLHARMINLGIKADTASTPVPYNIDDVKLACTRPAYTPSYELHGGVVGTFLHDVTEKRYIIVVNTDTVNPKPVTVNVVGNSGAATTAKNVDTGTVYNLSPGSGYGVLDISLEAGDGALLEVDGTTTLYSNNMETASTYGSGTLVTTPAPHGGVKSEQRPADGAIYSSSALNLALPASASNFTYSVWVTDNNDPSQMYRLLVKFRNPTTGAISPLSNTPWTSAGTGWTQLSGDFTSIVNQRIGEGYTQLSMISLGAWSGTTAPPFVTYYADDMLVQYQ
ncbi:MAG: hypothetical protein ACHBMF_08925 [Chromatiales bacterium]